MQNFQAEDEEDLSDMDERNGINQNSIYISGTSLLN